MTTKKKNDDHTCIFESTTSSHSKSFFSAEEAIDIVLAVFMNYRLSATAAKPHDHRVHKGGEASTVQKRQQPNLEDAMCKRHVRIN